MRSWNLGSGTETAKFLMWLVHYLLVLFALVPLHSCGAGCVPRRPAVLAFVLGGAVVRAHTPCWSACASARTWPDEHGMHYHHVRCATAFQGRARAGARNLDRHNPATCAAHPGPRPVRAAAAAPACSWPSRDWDWKPSRYRNRLTAAQTAPVQKQCEIKLRVAPALAI